MNKERFEAKCEAVPESGCWIWMGATTGRSGYGHLTYKRRNITAHKASWQINFGAVPVGFYVLHRCDVKLCVNPAHLFLGTHKDNMSDMVRKNRSNVGEKNGAAKLTEGEVRKIRELLESNSAYAVARLYGMSDSAILSIKNGEAWSHI